MKDVEWKRRPSSDAVALALEKSGFREIAARSLWEVRREYDDFSSLADDLTARSGRSILHELDDSELHRLISRIRRDCEAQVRFVDKDRWTVWIARKPLGS